MKAADVQIDEDREWTDFDIMARDYSPPEENYFTCQAEYGEGYAEKRFKVFNLHSATLSPVDIPWVVSLLGNRGDHRFTKIYMDDFSVLDEENEDCSDEQLALVFAKLLKGRPYDECGSVCEQFAISFGESTSYMPKTSLQIGNLLQSIVPENKAMACNL